MMKPSAGYEHSFGRPTAAVSTHSCVWQKKSIAGYTQVARAGRPTAAVGIHMCVFLNTHLSGAKQVKGNFVNFKDLADRLLL